MRCLLRLMPFQNGPQLLVVAAPLATVCYGYDEPLKGADNMEESWFGL